MFQKRVTQVKGIRRYGLPVTNLSRRWRARHREHGDTVTTWEGDRWGPHVPRWPLSHLHNCPITRGSPGTHMTSQVNCASITNQNTGPSTTHPHPRKRKKYCQHVRPGRNVRTPFPLATFALTYEGRVARTCPHHLTRVPLSEFGLGKCSRK